MKRNSLSLDKTRIVIAGLLVTAILAITFFATTLNSFAHEAASQPNQCAGNTLAHLKAADQSTTLAEAKKHLGAVFTCLGVSPNNNTN